MPTATAEGRKRPRVNRACPERGDGPNPAENAGCAASNPAENVGSTGPVAFFRIPKKNPCLTGMPRGVTSLTVRRNARVPWARAAVQHL